MTGVVPADSIVAKDDHYLQRGLPVNRVLEPRDGGGIVGETFRIYGRNCLRLWAITAIAMVIISAWYLAITYALYGSDPYDPGNMVGLPLIWLSILLSWIGTVVGWPLMLGALIHAVSEQHFRTPVAIGRAYSYAWRRFGNLLAAFFLYAGAIFLLSMTFIGIPFAIYLAVRWGFCLHAVALEGLGPIDALSRSWSLVGGYWWRTFGVLLLAWLATAVIGGVFAFALWWGPFAVSALASVIAGIVATPILVIAATLLYYDTRLKKETYSFNALAYELGIQHPGAAV